MLLKINILSLLRNHQLLHHQIRRMANKAVVNGTAISYEQAGSGPHVALCMPGALGAGATDFAPQLASLAGSALTLVAWDPPGYGASRPPDRQFTPNFFEEDADTAAGLMKTLGHERYSLLGWSDGGNSAVLLAARHQQHVSKLVVWGANAYVTDQDIQLYEAVRDIDRWSERMKAPMLEMYGERYFRDTWTAWVDAISAYRHRPNGICRRECAQVRCPALVVHGARDAMVPDFHPHYFVDHIPHAALHVFPQGKHNLHLRYADDFNALVREFLLK